MVFPRKLKAGDLVRIIAPSTSGSIISSSTESIFFERFKSELGLNIEWASGSRLQPDPLDANNSTPISVRLKDLHEAFLDEKVAAVFTIIGGFNSNQLLPYIDYGIIKSNPKILCGYSDITALANGIHAQTGLVTYIGPHASSFGMIHGIENTLKWLKACLFEDCPFILEPSINWRCDPWYLNQEEILYRPNSDGMKIIHGSIPENGIEGTIIGGNLMVLSLLQGTPFMPDTHDNDLVLFLEYCNEYLPEMEERFIEQRLHSLLQVPFVRSKLKVIVWGRFEPSSVMNLKKMQRIFEILLKDNKDVIVIGDADHGHTTPIFTFPIGGKIRISRGAEKTPLIEILKH